MALEGKKLLIRSIVKCRIQISTAIFDHGEAEILIGSFDQRRELFYTYTCETARFTR